MSRLWYTRCPAPTPFGITVQKGWLKEEFDFDAWVDPAPLRAALARQHALTTPV
ncbi:hypothetical protein PQQ75_21820 [Paraburkholderia aspalathi]|uniref:hypothetical protein n=1 Tax=Paraburkholderia aspalathi TaxID=1324617 RepID=UPI0038BDB1DC